MQGQQVKIRLRYQKSVFDDISSVLNAVGGKKLVQQFLDGCFGHLMNFIGGKRSSCTTALHELISHEIALSDAREDELWFRIGGTNIRFSSQEYALITGLRFGSSSFDPLGSHEMPKGGVCRRFFKGRPITVKELWKKYNMQRVGRSSEDYLKVAYVLALYLMVLGYGQPKVVDQWVWVLAEDLDSWNRFPWGAYTYQALMHYASFLPKSRAGLGELYYFVGPAWALQIWGYEAIPHLGNTCARITGKVTMPRCLKWSFHSEKKNLARIFKEELECFVTLEPTEEEKLQPYWVSLQTSQPLGVRYTHPAQGTKSRALLAPAKRAPSQQRRNSPAKHDVPFHDSDSDASSQSPSPRPKRARASKRLNLSIGDINDRPHGVPQAFDETRFVDRVSDRVVSRLIKPIAECVSQQLIPQIKQLMESRPPQPPRDQLDYGNRRGAVDQDQIGSSEVELKRKSQTSPSSEGDEANVASKKKNKKRRRSPLSSEDEGSESSSGNERRRKLKKRSKKKKKKRKHSEPSLSESSCTDSDRRRRKRNKHKRRRRSSSSNASDSGSP